MIIRNKNLVKNLYDDDKKEKNPSSVKKSSVIKKEGLILDAKSALNETQKKELKEIEIEKPNEFEKIDISSIEFKERIERRRGDRRRGYRRIDERSLVTRAQQEAHTIKELASREGYQNGIKKAQEELDEIKNAINEFLSSKDEMYEEFYPHIMEISLAVAKKIIQKEVELSPDILKNIVMTTLDELNSDVQKVEIKVNNDDLEFARASLPELISQKGDNIKVAINQDENIEKGSCIIIANNGVIDANFKTQLSVLSNAFGIYKGGF